MLVCSSRENKHQERNPAIYRLTEKSLSVKIRHACEIPKPFLDWIKEMLNKAVEKLEEAASNRQNINVGAVELLRLLEKANEISQSADSMSSEQLTRLSVEIDCVLRSLDR